MVSWILLPPMSTWDSRLPSWYIYKYPTKALHFLATKFIVSYYNCQLFFDQKLILCDLASAYFDVIILQVCSFPYIIYSHLLFSLFKIDIVLLEYYISNTYPPFLLGVQIGVLRKELKALLHFVWNLECTTPSTSLLFASLGPPSTTFAHLKNLMYSIYEWFDPRPMRCVTCHLFFEGLFVTLVYHPPVA